MAFKQALVSCYNSAAGFIGKAEACVIAQRRGPDLHDMSLVKLRSVEELQIIRKKNTGVISGCDLTGKRGAHTKYEMPDTRYEYYVSPYSLRSLVQTLLSHGAIGEIFRRRTLCKVGPFRPKFMSLFGSIQSSL